MTLTPSSCSFFATPRVSSPPIAMSASIPRLCEVVLDPLDAVLDLERVGPAGAEDRAAAGQDAADLVDAEGHGLALERTPPAVPEADELVAVDADTLADDGADHGVESGAVSAAGQDTDAHQNLLDRVFVRSLRKGRVRLVRAERAHLSVRIMPCSAGSGHLSPVPDGQGTLSRRRRMTVDSVRRTLAVVSLALAVAVPAGGVSSAAAKPKPSDHPAAPAPASAADMAALQHQLDRASAQADRATKAVLAAAARSVSLRVTLDDVAAEQAQVQSQLNATAAELYEQAPPQGAARHLVAVHRPGRDAGAGERRVCSGERGAGSAVACQRRRRAAHRADPEGRPGATRPGNAGRCRLRRPGQGPLADRQPAGRTARPGQGGGGQEGRRRQPTPSSPGSRPPRPSSTRSPAS